MSGCIMHGCQDKHAAKGYCARHYAAMRSHSRPSDQRYDPLTEPCGQVWDTTEAQKARAVRVVASLARSGEDAVMLLDALGLSAEEGKNL